VVLSDRYLQPVHEGELDLKLQFSRQGLDTWTHEPSATGAQTKHIRKVTLCDVEVGVWCVFSEKRMMDAVFYLDIVNYERWQRHSSGS
jgi:hypothetical protein